MWGISCITVCEAGAPAGGDDENVGGDTGGSDAGGNVDPDPCGATLCLQNGKCVICSGG